MLSVNILAQELFLYSNSRVRCSQRILFGVSILTLSLGLVESLDSGGRVHVHLSSHDKTILEELSDVLS